MLVCACAERAVSVQEEESAVERYRSVELWGEVKWGKFRDGWPNIFIENVSAIAGRDGKVCPPPSDHARHCLTLQ